MDEDEPTKPEERFTEQSQRLYLELFEKVGGLIDDGVEIEELRHALQKSFMITASPKQREGWEKLRLEMDAYLRARRDGEAAVEVPEGFVPSPDLSKPDEKDD